MNIKVKRRAYYLHTVMGLTKTEIAKIEGVSCETVRQRIAYIERNSVRRPKEYRLLTPFLQR